MKIKNENSVGQLYRHPATKKTLVFNPQEEKVVKKEIGEKLLELRGFSEVKKEVTEDD